VEATAENWESEFLVVGVVALLGIRLRQRGSPESKPVAAPTARPATPSGCKSPVAAARPP